MDTCDLAVIGLGTAGAAVSAHAAELGLKVIGLDSRPRAQAGARWVNGVAAWQFDRAGVARPEAPELRAQRVPMHLIAGWGPQRLTVRDHDLLEVDMRLLVERLQTRALAAGAELRQAKALGYAGEVLQTDQGPIQARFVADASGMNGAGLLERPRLNPAQICTAAQEVRRVRDLQAAERFVREHGARFGETLCFTCVAGGYSIVNLRVDGDEVSLLTGSIPADGVPSGRQLLDRFVAEQGWVGEVIFGGARPLPVRPPELRLGEGRVALLGDAGSQVFAMHGSGIGMGMISARLLAETLARGGSPEDYNYQWQRSWGGRLASAALFARFSTRLRPEDLRGLFDSGLMSVGLMRRGLDQQPSRPDLVELPALSWGALSSPRITLGVAPTIARMSALQALYATFPRDPAGIPAFEARLSWLLGEAG